MTRLVHLADLHLGFRQYERQNGAGINMREADVAATLVRSIDKVIEIAPHIVLIAGDVFHQVRPSNKTIVHAFGEFSRLMTALPATKVVMVAGNHDTPRTAEVGCILNLFEKLGVTVIARHAERIQFPELELSVLAVPDVPGKRPALEPDASSKYNVLLLHGEIAGVIPHAPATPGEISEEELGAARWDYVALGHYHVYHAVAPNAFYSGSLDYTSSNSWGEVRSEIEKGVSKGLIEQDLANKTHTFHPVLPTRRWIDLTPLSGAGLSPVALDELIRDAVEKVDGGIDDKIVRLLVRDVPRHILKELDQKQLRAFKRRALHFHLDMRRPELLVAGAASMGSPRRGKPLADVVRDKLLERPLTDDINREALIELALKYLGEADEVAAPSPMEAQ